MTTGIGIPLSIILGSITVFTSLANGVVKPTTKLFNVKAKKHSYICIAAHTLLDGIICMVSKAFQSGDISASEFDKIMSEKQRYLIQKQSIRSKSKKLIGEINEVQRQEIFEQGRKQGREEIAKKLVDSTDTRPAGVV